MKQTLARVTRITKILKNKFDWNFEDNSISDTAKMLFKTCPDDSVDFTQFQQKAEAYSFDFYKNWVKNIEALDNWSCSDDGIVDLVIAVYMTRK